jgi:hypothetical protein
MSYLSGVMEKLKEVESKVMVISPTNYYIMSPIYHQLNNITWFRFFIHQITPTKGETTRKKHYDTDCDKQFISDMNDTYTVSNSMVTWKMENKERHSFFTWIFFLTIVFFLGTKASFPPYNWIVSLLCFFFFFTFFLE